MKPIRPRLRRIARRAVEEVDAHARYGGGQLRGLAYRVRGQAPDPDVSDDVLADRVRSRIGPLRRRLDIPRVHVMVDNHVASIHGDVTMRLDADVLEAAVAAVPGVAAVDSHLHVGLLPSDTRPAEGRAHAHSQARRRLLEAAVEAGGVDEAKGMVLVKAVLRTLTERLPADEREQFLSHLPEDVRRLARPRFGALEAVNRIRTRTDFTLVVAGSAHLPYRRASHVCEALLGVMRELVPDEAADVSAVLPKDLRELWDSAVPG